MTIGEALARHHAAHGLTLGTEVAIAAVVWIGIRTISGVLAPGP